MIMIAMKAHALKMATFLVLSLLLLQCRHQVNGESQKEKDRGSIYETKIEPDPLPPVDVAISGEYLKAFSVAYEAFRNDVEIPEQKRKLENYRIEFRQKGDAYLMLFSAKRLPSESDIVGGESELGKDVLYRVSKRDYRMLGRNFFK